jgi:2-(1,2-epoxy-1,2-dihydrophenyl)acetyl-CoA isomerase
VDQAKLRDLETGTDELRARIEDGVALLTLHRPERRNALTPTLMTALGACLENLRRDPQIGCVLLTGSGDAFCAGGDVQSLAAEAHRGDFSAATGRFENSVRELQRIQREVVLALHEMPIPSVAALPGAAAGAGLSIALACDLRIASERALITTAFARLGLSGDFGGSWFLTRLLGSARARELYFLSERIDAATCERFGLVHHVVAHEKLAAEAQALARRLAHGPRVALASMKENLNRALHLDLASCLDAEASAMRRCQSTEDHAEAARAFLEKREPRFRGR